MSIPNWISRCGTLDKTVEIGTTSRGTATRLIRPALPMIDIVPVDQASAKKLNGMIPQRTKTGKCGSAEVKILV